MGGNTMVQIIKNYLYIFIIPLALGVIVRVLIRKKSKAWIFSVVCAALTAAVGILFAVIDTHGDEGLGLFFIQTVCLLVGSLAAAGVSKIVKKQ